MTSPFFKSHFAFVRLLLSDKLLIGLAQPVEWDGDRFAILALQLHLAIGHFDEFRFDAEFSGVVAPDAESSRGGSGTSIGNRDSQNRQLGRRPLATDRLNFSQDRRLIVE